MRNQIVNLAIQQLETADNCRLFTVLKFKELTNYRVGYYYGSQIIKIIQKERSNIEILTLDFDQVKKYIYEYFSLKNL